jgi:hypothetical protein
MRPRVQTQCCQKKKERKRKKEGNKQTNKTSRAPVTLACNPSYSGGRDQEDCDLKSAQTNSSTRPYLEKPSTHTQMLME